ncbi:MAG TPA: hypothetical protein VII58_06440 [Acidobacteriaceae bacterium]
MSDTKIHPCRAILDLTDEEFHRQICDAIQRELGLASYARFLRLFCSGRGDYAAGRHQRLSGLTLEDIQRELNADK